MKAQRVLTVAVALVTLGASATYMFVYLYRWEWNRALISGIVFLAAEVGVAAWSIHLRLGELDRRVDALSARRARIDGYLDEARSRPSRAFAWLNDDSSRVGVFVPILLGAGLVVSSLAWILDHLGRATAGRLDDRRLAARLARLGPPAQGFLVDPDDDLRVLRAPRATGRSGG